VVNLILSQICQVDVILDVKLSTVPLKIFLLDKVQSLIQGHPISAVNLAFLNVTKAVNLLLEVMSSIRQLFSLHGCLAFPSPLYSLGYEYCVIMSLYCVQGAAHLRHMFESGDVDCLPRKRLLHLLSLVITHESYATLICPAHKLVFMMQGASLDEKGCRDLMSLIIESRFYNEALRWLKNVFSEVQRFRDF
jgi:hypothetical protein